jgi:hypothetical protein
MEKNILTKLNNLEKAIKTEDITQKASDTKEWGGADVIISKTMNKQIQEWLESGSIVISFQDTAPKRRAVITEYSKELSWLFEQLKNIFTGEIDFISKYDFYGSLAQSAIDYLEASKGNIKMEDLLLSVINALRRFLDR